MGFVEVAVASNWKAWTPLTCAVDIKWTVARANVASPMNLAVECSQKMPTPPPVLTSAPMRRWTRHPPSSESSGCSDEREWCSYWSLPATLGPKLSLQPEAECWLAIPGLGWACLSDPISTPPFLKHLSFIPQGMVQMGWADMGRGWGGPRASRANAASEMEIQGGLTSSQADWAHSSYGQDESRPAPGRVAIPRGVPPYGHCILLFSSHR